MERNCILRSALLLVFLIVFVIAANARAQQLEVGALQPEASARFEAPPPEITQPATKARFEFVQPAIGPAQPAGKKRGAFVAIPFGVAGEFASTARDFATFRDTQWTVLTVAQIGASAADADTSLYNLRHCATCREIGTSRLVVGSRPDAHKYIIAGLVEITVEAVAAHYLHSRGPTQKWYWRFVWTLPQTLSLYGHATAAFHNAGVNLGCDPVGQHC